MGAIILSSIFVEGDVGRYIFLVFGIFLAFAGVYEYLKMIEKFGVPGLPVLTAAVGSSILAASVLELPSMFYIVVLTVSVIAGWIHLMLADNKEVALKKNLSSFSALPMIVFPLNFLALIYVMNSGHVSGRIYFLFMLLVTKFGDIGAYTVGTISSKVMPGGNHKIIPKISPKKSWEGTLGGMCISILVSYIFCHYVPGLISDFGKIFPLVAGFILFWGGFIGDLVESSLKRTAGVKDSGNMIPGMGGALDVIDSLVLNAPIFYLFLIIAGGK
jgi:phosphatidate cytidylyltransferase